MNPRNLVCLLLVVVLSSPAIASDIYGFDLDTKTEFVVARDGEGATVGNGYLVWESRKYSDEIGDWGYSAFARKIATGEEFTIASGLPLSADVDVSGDIVVWTDSSVADDYDIYATDLTTGVATNISPAVDGSQIRPRISGDTVVYYDYRSGAGQGDIYMRNLATGTETPVCTAPGMQVWPSTDGHYVVWTDMRAGTVIGACIYGYDIATGQEFLVAAPDVFAGFPEVGDGVVVWEDNRHIEPGVIQRSIYGYDIATATEFAVHTTQFPVIGPNRPSIDGNTVVWEDYRHNSSDIYGKDIGPVLTGLTTDSPYVFSSASGDFAICTAVGGQYAPVVGDGTVVWLDDRAAGPSAAVPEPGSLALILVGLAGLIRRS